MKKYILFSLLFIKIAVLSAQATLDLQVVTYASNKVTFEIFLTPGATNPVYLGNMTLNINFPNTTVVEMAVETEPTLLNSNTTQTIFYGFDISILPALPTITNSVPININAPGVTNTSQFNARVAKITSKTSLGIYSITFNGTQSGTLSCGGATLSVVNTTTFNFNPITATCSGNVVLPLDLLSFTATANNKTNLLSWQTANELNTQSFDIERSANGKNFEKVGNVKSVGTAKGAYQFTDEVPLSGINYYRLKMMDIDGSFTYSPIRSVVLGQGKATNVSIAPNPAKGQVFVKFNADDAKAITLVLVDVTGKTVLTERKNLESGFNQLPLNVSSYPQGLYFLKIVDANTTETHRLVIGN